MLLLFVLLQAGCLAKRSDYAVPEIPLPTQYRNTLSSPGDKAMMPNEAAISAEAATAPLPPSPPPDAGIGLVEWWHSFGSEELEALIDRGMANNADIRMATLRVVQAKARADQAGAGRLPTLSAPLVAANQYPGGVTVGTVPPAANDGSSSSSSSSGGESTSQKSFQASLRADWRLDVWGEQSALVESAGLQLWRAMFERDNAKRSMAATVASFYIEYIALNDRLRVAREMETVLAATLATVEKRVGVGDATLSELEQQRAAIFSLRASIPSMEQQREDVTNSIAFLVGTVPGGLTLSDQGLDSLTLPEVVPGLPSSLLLRRPDVRMAEARLLAADADVDVARARILPPMDLSAQAGYSSLSLSQLFLPKALFWNAVASLTVNIFDGGKRSSEKALAQAMQEEMVESYVRTLYQAMREVEGALASVRLAEKRLVAQQETVGASRRAWDISKKVYAVGSIDYMTLLETERSYHRYLDEYQRIRMDYYRGYVTLFQSLGGGVQPREKLPGKGARPLADSAASPQVSRAPKKPRNNVAAEGVGWGGSRGLQIEDFWQVELAGLYDRTTIGAAWRDLRSRYPEWMDGRMLRPRLQGHMGDDADNQEAWYRLYVAKFDTPALAASFCAVLNSGQQRCRVVSSRSDETVTSPPLAKSDKPAAPLSASPMTSASEISPAMAEEKQPGTGLESAMPSVQALPQADTDNELTIPRDEVAKREPSSRTKRNLRSPPGVGHEPREKLAYAVQLGAFANKENAALAQTFWKQKTYDVYVSENRDSSQKVWYVVRTGVYPQRREALARAQFFRNTEAVEALAVPILVDRQGKPNMLEIGDPTAAEPGTLSPAVPEPPEVGPVDAKAAALTVSDKAATRQKEKPALRRPVPVTYAIQFGAFSSPENAQVAFEFWRDKGHGPYISDIKDVDGRRWYAVRTGNYAQRREALAAALEFGQREGVPVTVVPVGQTSEGSSSTEVEQPVAVATAAPTSHGAYTVQLAAFARAENAARAMVAWSKRGYPVYVSRIADAGNGIRYALRSGSFDKPKSGLALMKKLDKKSQRSARLTSVGIEDVDRLSLEELSVLH